MTRINTNVPSLVAQNRLQRSNDDLQTRLTRLSTGLKINTGKDDPAGLIASEALRSEITSINKALSNTKRANQIIATADSALSQVSTLLNDVRGLVVEAANNGALSEDEIAANQLQIDSSLKAINRIAQSTTFQGRKLLDGSLDFTTTAGTNFDKISDLSIEQANLGSSGSVSVAVNVTTAATKAQVDITNIPTATAAANAFQNFSFSKAQAQATGGVVTYGSGTINIAAAAGGTAAGAEGNGTPTISLTYGNGAASSTYDANTNTLTVNVTTADGSTTADAIRTAINAGTAFTATAGANGGTTQAAATAATVSTPLTGGRDAGSATLKVYSDTASGAANGVSVTFQEDNTIGANSATAEISGGNILVKLRGTVSYSAIATQINNLSGYSAVLTASSGDQNYIDTADAPPASANLGGGQAAGGGLSQDVVFSLGGKNGSEVFNFKAGTSLSQLVSAINLVKDSTGVEATANSTTLELTSSEYGAASYVNVEVISETAGGTITTGLGAVSKKRDTGDDIVATVNGIRAKGEGNSLSINSSSLDFKATIAAAFTGTANFNITGGGALFQLGPDVVSNQQARLGLTAVSTGRLGGVNGRLYELGSGEAKALATNATGAAKVINEVIDKVTSLRGRLGAFQRTTLDSNLASLTETVSNLTDAQSSIRDADFASESAALTRAQILVQSGTQVLTLANQNPQNVLSLLR